jgi:hypothetical protein
MRRTNRPAFLKKSELFIVILFLVLGLMLPTAYASISSPLVASPPVTQQPPSFAEAEAACQMIRAIKGVQECHVMDFTAFDVVVPALRQIDMAKTFCKEAANAIGSRFKNVAGKTYKVRISYSGEVLTTASCRVPAFSS